MLTCLYELKSTNVVLEDKLVLLARHRDYLLANNRQPEIPLNDTLQQNHLMSNRYLNFENTIIDILMFKQKCV